MKPTQIARLDAGLEGFTVEAVIGVVFDVRDGKFGPTQDIRVKDDDDSAREDEVTLRLRDHEAVPREARGHTLKVVPGEYKGKKTGVKWNVRTAADGRVFKEVVVSRSARVAIEGLGEVKALPKAVEEPAARTTPLASKPADDLASFDDFAAGKATAAPVAPAKAEAVLVSPKVTAQTTLAPTPAAPAVSAPSTYRPGNGKGQYTAEDLLSLAGYFAPRILALSLPESAVGVVLDGLLRVATVTGTRPPVVEAMPTAAPAQAITPAPAPAAPTPDGGTEVAPAVEAPASKDHGSNVVPFRAATGKQVALLRTLAREAGKDDAALLAVITNATDRRYDRLEDLTVQDASRLIEAVRKALRERAIKHYASVPAERKTA